MKTFMILCATLPVATLGSCTAGGRSDMLKGLLAEYPNKDPTYFDLAMLGTHHSPTTDPKNNILDICVDNLESAQDCTIPQQLAGGVRAFGLRPRCTDDLKLVHYHRFCEYDDFETILNQFKSFLDSHTSEIVSIQFENFDGFDSNECKVKFNDVIARTVSSRVLRKSATKNGWPTLRNMISDDTRVVFQVAGGETKHFTNLDYIHQWQRGNWFSSPNSDTFGEYHDTHVIREIEQDMFISAQVAERMRSLSTNHNRKPLWNLHMYPTPGGVPEPIKGMFIRLDDYFAGQSPDYASVQCILSTTQVNVLWVDYALQGRSTILVSHLESSMRSRWNTLPNDLPVSNCIPNLPGIVLYEGNSCSQNHVDTFSRSLSIQTNNIAQNDEARSMMLVGPLPRGFRVEVGDDPDHLCADDYTSVWLRNDIPKGKVVCVNTFETNSNFGDVRQVYERVNGLDGKVSRIKVTINTPASDPNHPDSISRCNIVLYEGDGCTQDTLGRLSWQESNDFRLPFGNLPSDEIRSFRLNGPIPAGFRIWFGDNPSWFSVDDQQITTAVLDLPAGKSTCVSMHDSWRAGSGAKLDVSLRHHNGLAGKVSRVRTQLLDAGFARATPQLRWSNDFSEEQGSSSSGMVLGMRCSGNYCDDKRILQTVDSPCLLSANWLSHWMSEETGRIDCPNGYVVTKLTCKSSRCDNIRILCQQLSTSCTLTGGSTWYSVPEHEDRLLRNGEVMTGMDCNGRYCSDVYIEGTKLAYISSPAARTTPPTKGEDEDSTGGAVARATGHVLSQVLVVLCIASISRL